MRQLDEGLYRIDGGSNTANTYLVAGDRLALIDPGRRVDVTRIRVELKRLPDLVINTHAHVDHAGGNRHFQDRSVVVAHRRAARTLTEGDPERLQCRVPESGEPDYRVHLWLRDGARLDLGGRTLRLIHTPGHTSGSACFYEPEAGWLFTGDTVFAHGKVSGTSRSGDALDYRQSLERLTAIGPDLLCPGHGPLSHSPSETLQAAIKQFENRFTTAGNENRGVEGGRRFHR